MTKTYTREYYSLDFDNPTELILEIQDDGYVVDEAHITEEQAKDMTWEDHILSHEDNVYRCFTGIGHSHGGMVDVIVGDDISDRPIPDGTLKSANPEQDEHSV